MPSLVANGVPEYPAAERPAAAGGGGPARRWGMRAIVGVAARPGGSPNLGPMTDRPPPEPEKLLSDWMEWERGETMPGRVISNLKTHGLRELLEALVAAPAPGPEA